MSSSVFLFPPHPTGIRSCPHYNGISCLRVTLTVSPLVLHVFSLSLCLSASLSSPISRKEVFVSGRRKCLRRNSDCVDRNFWKIRWFPSIFLVPDIFFNQVRGAIKGGGKCILFRIQKRKDTFFTIEQCFHSKQTIFQAPFQSALYARKCYASRERHTKEVLLP